MHFFQDAILRRQERSFISFEETCFVRQHRQAVQGNLLDPEDEGSKILRNSGKYLAVDTA
jgi:hypothetical protein